MTRMTSKRTGMLLLVILLLAFLLWRLFRPMNIFVVDERFAWPVDTADTPAVLQDLRAEQCGQCHPAFYQEWQTTIHARAWTDPYFQADWQFEKQPHNCRLCHTPLDRQQPELPVAYRDADRWNPVLVNNPDFDPALQHEGVTCAACHYRDGQILGVIGNTTAPHASRKISDPNQICLRCHQVEGDRWDTFYRLPPCGTVNEIRQNQITRNQKPRNQRPPSRQATTSAGENRAQTETPGSPGCVQCHMPLIERALVPGGPIRRTRHHYWRGGHDPNMVKQALQMHFSELAADEPGQRRFRFSIVNRGAAHYIPTGTPDRHLSIHFRLLDPHGKVLDQQQHLLKRSLMWRPFIVDLRDTRLPYGQPRQYHFRVAEQQGAHRVELVVKYHLLDEQRRRRIGYQNRSPVSYVIFRQQIPLSGENHE